MTNASTTPTPLQTAVLFLVFNRPDTTAQVFEAIRQAKPSRLYVAADGPRANREGEAEKVARVREIASAVDWACELKMLFRDENLGCKYAVSGALNWFFEQEEQGIILEDDCLPSQSFFRFCDYALTRFKNNDHIMAVTGTNITHGITFDADYWFSNYALMWGWATWRRAWDKYDLELNTWPEINASDFFKKSMHFGLNEISNWKRILDRTYLGEIDTWDYQWIYSCWINKSLTVAPRVNLVRNLGFSDQATHTFGYDPIRSNLVAEEMEFPLRAPAFVAVNEIADKFISKYWFHISLPHFFKSFLIKLPGMSRMNRLWKIFVNS